MAEYIERDLALRVIKQKQKELCPFGTYGKKYVDGYEREKFDEWQEIIDEIESVPAADTAEVQRSHWEFPIFTDSDDGLDPRVKCSECGGIEAAFARWKYCPNCGAKMTED